ncbi:alpha,alpha-trehalase [Candidatus Parcubacteria bacterium]|nr:alpha,alpha-trehalase [Candidatus Parcubacteria bacterium]
MLKTTDVTNFSTDDLQKAVDYVESHWQTLERYFPHDDGTLIGVPGPYIVPSRANGSGFCFEEMYYWDCYFTAQAFMGTKREKLAFSMADNLTAMMKRFGVIPNGNRFYFTSRSQPPFLSSFILDLYNCRPNKRWLASRMDVAKDEYRKVWMGTAHPHWRQVFAGLSRYYDVNVMDELAELESGWDLTTRFGGKCLSYIPVDLNALLYKYEKDFETAALILGDTDEAAAWNRRALKRKTAINRYMWNEEAGFYFDYNFATREHSPVWSLAGYFPLWAGMVSPAKAARLAQNLGKFEAPGGLTATAATPRVATALPAQWAHPNGWAPLHWITIQGLRCYGYNHDADRITRKWVGTNLSQFKRQGAFFEKYNVVDPTAPPLDGLYPAQTGFGWSNAVFSCLAQDMLSTRPVAKGCYSWRQLLQPALSR